MELSVITMNPSHDLKGAEVLPGVGLGELRFGMTLPEVESQVGAAPKSETVEDGTHSYSYLEYLKGEVLLFFDQDMGFRLSSIEADTESGILLFGVPLFGLTLAQVRDLLRQHLSEEALRTISEDKDEMIEEATLNVSGLRMTFCFALDEILGQVHWGPLFGSNDEVIWPSP